MNPSTSSGQASKLQTNPFNRDEGDKRDKDSPEFRVQRGIAGLTFEV
jgi:hypothetical protein